MTLSVPLLVFISTVMHAVWNLMARKQRSESIFLHRMNVWIVTIGLLPFVLSEFLTRSFSSTAWLCLGISLVLMFLSLKFMVDLARGLVVSRAERVLNRYLFGAPILAMLSGLVLTALVQSSSITTSLVIPLVGAGILTVQQIFPYTLGANVGTTVTAMLAALSTGNVAAVTIAFAHLLFNVTGIALIYPLAPIRAIPIRLAISVAAFTSRSRAAALLLILVFFYVLPAAVILLSR